MRAGGFDSRETAVHEGIVVTITATGIFRQPERLAHLVAGSARFQTVVGAADATEALAFTEWPWTDESSDTWPRAIITQNADWRMTQSGTKNWSVQGSLFLVFQFSVPTSAGATTEKDQYHWFMNQIGQIVAEMKVLEGTAEPFPGETHLAIDFISVADGPYKDEESETEVPDPASSSLLPRWWIVLEVGYR